MSNEAFKNQKLSSHEYFQAKRWQGKPFLCDVWVTGFSFYLYIPASHLVHYQFKFMIANYPELALMGLASVIAPIILYCKWITGPGSKKEAIAKYKPNYTVVRDDDPNLEAIIKQKEFGREFFPQ